MKSLIITADDFGAAREVNEAVERAHKDGILTATSLMVAAPAATDAVVRAKAMPRLGVGLHIVLAEGKSVLPPSAIPDLVDADGMFRPDMVWPAVKMFFLPQVRRQLAAEIEAQFRAFAATGLTLDHVDTHKHFHLHPTVLKLILKIGPRYGMKALRLPYEPSQVLKRVEPGTHGAPVLGWWARSFRRKLAGHFAPDAMFGLAWSGAMSESRLAGLIAHLPEGISEIYLHPATGPYAGSTPGYRYGEELTALISRQVVDTARQCRLGPFADFALSA
jgi:hopanoid biosynthesis associated protein HpnK